MTKAEVRFFNLIDQLSAEYGYGVERLERSPDGSYYRVAMSSPSEGKRRKRFVFFRDAVEETLVKNRLAPPILKNIDRELSDGYCGRL